MGEAEWRQKARERCIGVVVAAAEAVVGRIDGRSIGGGRRGRGRWLMGNG